MGNACFIGSISKWRHVGINRGFFELLKPPAPDVTPLPCMHSFLRKFSTLTCRGLRSTTMLYATPFSILSPRRPRKNHGEGCNYFFYEGCVVASARHKRFIRDYVYDFVVNWWKSWFTERIDKYLAGFVDRKNCRDSCFCIFLLFRTRYYNVLFLLWVVFHFKKTRFIDRTFREL